MLERVKYTTIRDICTKDLIFYEKEQADNLAELCKENSISYLPDKDRKTCWQLKGDSFIHLKKIPSKLICAPTYLIFDEHTIDKFEKGGNHDEVMFVVEKNLIKGMVHIIDYNNDDLFVELYRMLLNFENNLRTLLIQKKLKNKDFIQWLKKEGEKEKKSNKYLYYHKKYQQANRQAEVEKRENANPFQTFYLRDLVQFAFAQQLLSEKGFDIDAISDLRNWIAHAKDITSTKKDPDRTVYNINGLKKFIAIVRSFFKSYEILEIKLD